MSEVIAPFDKFTHAREVTDLARRIRHFVHDPGVKQLLDLRHLTGVQQRYSGNHGTAVHRITTARANHKEGVVGAYAVLSAKGDVIGTATVMPGLKLTRHKTVIPNLLPFGLLREDIPMRGPEVTVWTNETVFDESISHASRLAKAYQALVAKDGPAEIFQRLHEGGVTETGPPNTWTIEPQRVPLWIHAAICSSGLAPHDAARYDDQEPERWVYPVSNLYTLYAPEA